MTFLISTNPVVTISGIDPIASTIGPTPVVSIQDGTVEQKGAVQLEDSIISTSITKAATPKSIKKSYDYTITVSGNLQSNIDGKSDIGHDHIQYLLTDGTRAMTDDLDIGSHSINNMNVANLKAICCTVHNATGSTLTVGTCIYPNGISGSIVTVDKCDITDRNKMPCLGVISSNIVNGANGRAVTRGIKGMDTSGFAGSVGERVYIQVDGFINTTVPTSGSVQRIGILTVKAVDGQIYIHSRGRKSIFAAADEHPEIRMGNDAGHQKICFLDYTNNEKGCIDSDGNLTLSGTVDTVDIATFKSDYDNHNHDDKYYTETEVDTISGTLQTDIDGKSDIGHEHIELDITDLDKYTQAEVDSLITTVSGKLDDHNELNNLDYASAGHTGFASTDDLTTISGILQTDIDTKLENVIEDTTPELGGDLGCGGYNLDNVGKFCSLSFATVVYNDTGATLVRGTAVTICGLNGEVCTVCKTDNREVTKMPCCGIIYADITNGNEGCGIRLGRINMNTSGMAGNEGDRLYVQPDGTIDTTIPTSGMVQRVGFLVVKASGSAGRICVCIRGPRSMYSAKDQHPIVRMGDDAGHQKIVFNDYTNNEVAAFDDSGNLTLSGTVDGVDVATLKSDYDSHEHDDRYYTESEVDTISGSLNTKIDGKDNYQNWKFAVDGVTKDAITSEDVLDFVSGDNITITRSADDKITISGTAGGGVSNHSELTELDYASAGHTGFASTTVTDTLDTKIDTASGTLQTDIDTRAVSGGVEHDGFNDFVGNEHIDHSGVNITAGTGLIGGGDITTTRTLDVDVGITDDKIVQIDDLDAASGDYCKLTASGIEGRSYAETLGDLNGVAQRILGEHDIKLDSLLSADGKYSGITCDGVLGATLSVGNLVYLNEADQRWKLADADAEATSGDVMLAIVLAAGNDGNTRLLLLQGFVRLNTWNWSTYGHSLFVSCTAGDMTATTVSGSGDIVRVVGYVSTFADQIYFNPDGSWLEVA